MKHLNRRKRVMAGVALATAFLLAVFIGGLSALNWQWRQTLLRRTFLRERDIFWHGLDGTGYAGADVERTVFEHFSWNPGSRGQRIVLP